MKPRLKRRGFIVLMSLKTLMSLKSLKTLKPLLKLPNSHVHAAALECLHYGLGVGVAVASGAVSP